MSFVLLAGAILGFTIGRVFQTPPSGFHEEKTPMTSNSRTNQERTGRRISRSTSPSNGNLRCQISLDHQTLVNMADCNDLDLNPLTVARIVAEVGKLDEQGIRDLLGDSDFVAAESDFIEQVKISAFIRWVELQGPEAFSDESANEILSNRFFDESQTIAQGIGLWTLNHPDEARRWAEEFIVDWETLASSGYEVPMQLDEQDLLSAFIQSHERVRKGQTRELVSFMTSEEMRDVFLERLAEAEVVYTDSTTDLRELLDNEDLFLQRHAFEKFLTVDPSFAREWVSHQVPSKTRDQMIAEAADSYLDIDFSQGMQWFLQQELSNPSARSERLVTLVSTLSYQEDGRSAADWLLQQPDNAERDQAEMFMAHQRLASRDFEEGVTWIFGISDPDLRKEIISGVLPPEVSSGIEGQHLHSSSALINPNSIGAIPNHSNRTNSDFIATVDRVHIPGIPGIYSENDRLQFREAAEQAGLIQPEEFE